MKKFFFFLGIIIWLGAAFPAAAADTGKGQYSLEQKIGQMIAIGFRGLNVEDEPLLAGYIRQGKIGGVVLFNYDVMRRSLVRNIASPDQTAGLIDDLKELAEEPLFVMIDQEGGIVSRLIPEHGFAQTMSFKKLAALGDEEMFDAHVGAMVDTLSTIGINVNLAPVVDLELNLDNPIISGKERSFSADPAVVTELAQAFIDVHRQEGILTCLKHFPGHGSSALDTHETFVDISDSWQAIELDPYRALIKAGMVDMVMTAHIYHRDLDDKYPATLSPRIINGLLRDEMGYKGVVISDSLEMRAITGRYSLQETIYRTINAGVDILLYGNNMMYIPDMPDRIIAIVKAYVERGLIDEERIDESFARIMHLKSKLK